MKLTKGDVTIELADEIHIRAFLNNGYTKVVEESPKEVKEVKKVVKK